MAREFGLAKWPLDWSQAKGPMSRTGIISVIGNTGSKIIEHELVSKNEYGARYIIDTDDLSGAILELYQSLFSLQDCK